MNAAEARKRAISDEVVAAAKKHILERIAIACDSGKTSTTISQIRLEVASRALDGLGYTIEPSFFGALLIVSWEAS